MSLARDPAPMVPPIANPVKKLSSTPWNRLSTFFPKISLSTIFSVIVTNASDNPSAFPSTAQAPKALPLFRNFLYAPKFSSVTSLIALALLPPDIAFIVLVPMNFSTLPEIISAAPTNEAPKAFWLASASFKYSLQYLSVAASVAIKPTPAPGIILLRIESEDK